MSTPLTNETVMDAGTLEALRGSIAKWERVVSEGRDGTQWKDCPLCEKFWERNCAGCPVSERTGQKMCRGSPFVEYDEARDAFLAEDQESDPGRAPDVIAAAQAEVDFLKSLLPSEAQTALKETP